MGPSMVDKIACFLISSIQDTDGVAGAFPLLFMSHDS